MISLRDIMLEAEEDTVTNPKTGHKVKVSSALKYPKDSEVYKLAASKSKKSNASSGEDENGSSSKIADMSVAVEKAGDITRRFGSSVDFNSIREFGPSQKMNILKKFSELKKEDLDAINAMDIEKITMDLIEKRINAYVSDGSLQKTMVELENIGTCICIKKLQMMKENPPINADKYEKTLKDYADSGYVHINRAARKGTISGDPDALKELNDLKKFISENKAKDDMECYRGVSPSFLKEILKSGEFTDEAPISTTLNPKVALSFSNSEMSILKIHIKKGSPVAPMPIMDSLTLKECEFLCMPGSKFKVKKTDSESKFVEVEYIPPEENHGS